MDEEAQLKWGSHQPMLVECLAKSTGPVMEVGVGHFSTPLLHHYCKGANRRLISIEKDEKWFDLFNYLGTAGVHTFIHAEDYAASMQAQFTVVNRWGLCFIDNSPGGLARADLVKLAIPYCEYIVVHDYHDENEEHIEPLLDGLVMSWKVYKDYFPPTLVISHY